jgi:ABC-type long-subunit fatty acid transport system fused permease/ATPase subunit
MNFKQKITLWSGAVIIFLAALFWGISGFQIYTQTGVESEKTGGDGGITFGFDFLLYTVVSVVVVCTIFYFLFRKKREEIKK